MPSPKAIFSPAFRMRLRRFPALHRPLAWLNRSALPALASLAAWAGRRVFPASVALAPPRGWYSDLGEVRSGKALEGAVILEDQGSPRLPDPSIMLLCQRTQHQQQPWPVFWRRLDHARLAGRSLVHLNSARELSIEAVYGLPRLASDPAWLYWPARKPASLEGPWTSVVSRWLPNRGRSPYAHWLLDALPRLALLRYFPAETRILIPQDMYPAQHQSLELLGVSARCRPAPENHLLIERYYFSSPPSMIVCHSPYAVRFLREAFLPKVPESGPAPKRLFIRRTSQGRNMINEEEVLRFFEKLGWAVIDAAALSFADQVRWFAGAEAVCAIHGSGTANMVWCRPGCKFIEMFAADYLAGDQEWIAQCVQVDYHFMIFPCDYKLDAQIDLRALREKLARLGLL